MKALLLVVIWVIGILALSILTTVICYLPHDLALAKEIMVSILGNVTSAIFVGIVSFIAGVAVATLWFTRFNKLREWFADFFWDWNREDTYFMLLYFLLMLCFCPPISWCLDKTGLRLVPVGLAHWSWCSFANVLLSQIVYSVLFMAVAMFVSWLCKKSRRRRNGCRPII